MPGHHDVKARDGRQWYRVVHQEPDNGCQLGIGGPQFFWVRVTDFKERDVLILELAHVREHGCGQGTHDGQTPNDNGYCYRELGGSTAAHRCVQLAHRVHDSEEPVGAQSGQRENGHSGRYVLGGF